MIHSESISMVVPRIFILTTILFAFTNVSHAQIIGGKDSWWKFDFFGVNTYGEASVKFFKDTIIEQEHVDVYERWITSVYNDNSDTVDFFQGYLYIQNKPEGLVQYSMDAIDFDTLYHFNLPIGTSYTWYDRLLSTNLEFNVTIEGYYEFVNDSGEFETAQVISMDLFENTLLLDTIYNLYGSGNYYILPYDLVFQNADSGTGGAPVCFQSSSGDIELFTPISPFSRYNHNCEPTVTISPHITKRRRGATVYPNPCKNVFRLKLDSSKISRVEMVSIVSVTSGQMVKNVEFSGNSEIIFNVNSLPAGMYIVLIDGIVSNRIIKLD